MNLFRIFYCLFLFKIVSLSGQNDEVSRMLNKEIIIWDNDGTIMGSKNPNDPNKIILPNIQNVMSSTKAIHVLCSGCKTPESELQNFDPQNIIKRITALMSQLPIQVATFSPTIGGIECYVIIKKLKTNDIVIRKAHEEKRYQHLIGSFKKPEIGMFVVIQDILKEEFGYSMNSNNSLMIGDTWHDEHAALKKGIAFLDATHIHNMK